ncbi:MAG: hypothetical protein ABI831_23705, partial [Betaproteobacteria bacterium]
MAALLFVAGIVIMTFAVASALVYNGPLSYTRAGRMLAEAHAAAEYRAARLACQAYSAEARERCIAAAHADEERARAFAATARGGQIAAVRTVESGQSDPSGRGSIIVDPACNIVAGARGDLCEIQVSRVRSAGQQTTNLIPATTTLNLARNGRGRMPRVAARTQQAQPAALLAQSNPRDPQDSMF